MVSNDLQFISCEKTEADAQLIMTWRNNPTTLSMSYHQHPKVWPDFFTEYTQTYFAEEIPPPLFVTQEGKKVGFIRFQSVPNFIEPNAKMVDVSINIAPEARGKGVGLQSLLALSVYLKKYSSISHILAEVKVENEPSLHLFLKANYALIDQYEKFVPDIQKTFRIHRLVNSLT